MAGKQMGIHSIINSDTIKHAGDNFSDYERHTLNKMYRELGMEFAKKYAKLNKFYKYFKPSDGTFHIYPKKMNRTKAIMKGLSFYGIEYRMVIDE
jgi:hypothetical protein